MMETEFRLTVNGAERRVTCEPETPLVDVLRHDLGLAGPKLGCGMGLCGACLSACRLPRFERMQIAPHGTALCPARYCPDGRAGTGAPGAAQGDGDDERPAGLDR